MIRLFTALAVPPEIGEGLARRQLGLRGARWRPLESLHVTLCFVGEVSEHRAADIDAELSHLSAPALTLSLESVGAFEEGGDVHAVWAGVAENADLRLLAGRCERAARRAGAAIPKKTYRPHVTLAYLRHPDPKEVAAWIQDHSLLASPAFTAENFNLYSSWSTKEGSRYVLERSYPLKAGQGASNP
jgi:2'-5' RNA ligase